MKLLFNSLPLILIIAHVAVGHGDHGHHHHDHNHDHHDHDHGDHHHHHHSNNNNNQEYHPETIYLSKLEFIETFQMSNHLFDSSSSNGWVKSSETRYSQQEWAHGTTQDSKEPGIPGDKSIVVAIPHKHYGISKMIPSAIDNTGKDLVVQYEVRLHSGISCSGAYLKLITANKEFKPISLNENSEYTIMFGPDRCGATNKVHLIFRTKNPKSGVWEEKHLNKVIPAEIDNLSHLYTLEVKKDNTFRVLIDLVEKASGSLLDENLFNPPFAPSKEIDDPNDKKPSDWVDNEKMIDPTAQKPDDWDEDAPKRIQDPDAYKPSGWEDFEQEMIPDPNASQPSDWVTEEDGDWEPPLIKNPKCAVGCGTWTPPIIDNPQYKGKWSPPLIPNPDYIGQWKPRKIPNPNYYEETQPSNLSPIAAVAIEILANERGIGFDNIIVGHDLAAAYQFATETFVVKQKKESEIEAKSAKEKRIAERELLRKDGGFNHLIYYGVIIYDFALENLIPVVITSVVILLSFLYWCFSGVVPDAIQRAPEDIEPKTTDDDEEMIEEEEEEEVENKIKEVNEDDGAGATPNKDE